MRGIFLLGFYGLSESCFIFSLRTDFVSYQSSFHIHIDHGPFKSRRKHKIKSLEFCKETMSNTEDVNNFETYQGLK